MRPLFFDMILELYGQFKNSAGVNTDSRSIKSGEIFFALKGENFDGNLFAAKTIEEGASFVVVSSLPTPLPTGKYMLVEDTLVALQELAQLHRRKWGKQIVALTGSNGKTTTKELLREVLAKKYNVFATSGNLNNHIGVPLSLLSINDTHDIAVIEMGANHQNEIEQLCNIAEPTSGLITNIGKAHLEGFGGEQGVLKGKSELFDFLKQNNGSIFWNLGDEKLQAISESYHFALTYGTVESSVFARIISEVPALSIEWNGMHIQTHLTGAYNVQNILAAICVGQFYGVADNEIACAISGYIPSNSRSQIASVGKYKIILDAYNANPSSMAHALENLSKLDEQGFFVIGDMFELGESAPAEHQAIVSLSEKLKLKGIFIGENFNECKIGGESLAFSDKEKAAEFLKTQPPVCNYILLKGSRGMRMETLIDTIKEITL